MTAPILFVPAGVLLTHGPLAPVPAARDRTGGALVSLLVWLAFGVVAVDGAGIPPLPERGLIRRAS